MKWSKHDEMLSYSHIPVESIFSFLSVRRGYVLLTDIWQYLEMQIHKYKAFQALQMLGFSSL